MINQLHNPYYYNEDEEECIAAAHRNWESQRNCIKLLKAFMNVHFDNYQNEKCCYCGLLYQRTGRGEIDHIAPKGNDYYPQFSYESKNLAKACQLCNSSTMKHEFNTIQTLNVNYEQCDFNIVHPYLHNPDEHYCWKYGALKVIISVKNNSPKAKESIKLFELDSEKRTKARATQKNQERLERLYNITYEVKTRIMSVLKFR